MLRYLTENRMKLRSDLILRKMGDEHVIVDPSQDVVDMSKVYTLNETAAFIWNELQGIEFDIQVIAGVIFDNYDVEFSQALMDATILIENFSKEDLLES